MKNDILIKSAILLLTVVSCKQTSNSKNTTNSDHASQDTIGVQQKRQNKNTTNYKISDRIKNNPTYKFIKVFNEHISYNNPEINNSIKYIPKWDKWVVTKEPTENYNSYKEYITNTRIEVTVDTTDKFLLVHHLGTGGGKEKYEFTEISAGQKGEIYLSIYKKLSPEWEEFYPNLYFLDNNNNLKKLKQIIEPSRDSLYSFFFINDDNLKLIIEDQLIYLKYKYNHDNNHLIVKMAVSYLYDCQRDNFPSNISKAKKEKICETLKSRNETKALKFRWDQYKNKFVLIENNK